MHCLPWTGFLGQRNTLRTEHELSSPWCVIPFIDRHLRPRMIWKLWATSFSIKYDETLCIFLRSKIVTLVNYWLLATVSWPLFWLRKQRKREQRVKRKSKGWGEFLATVANFVTDTTYLERNSTSRTQKCPRKTLPEKVLKSISEQVQGLEKVVFGKC